jgi:hypothetical protein
LIKALVLVFSNSLGSCDGGIMGFLHKIVYAAYTPDVALTFLSLLHTRTIVVHHVPKKGLDRALTR